MLIDAADYYRAFYESARAARRYVLMSGWQFDSGVLLLRGNDAPPGAEVRFLPFLNALCRHLDPRRLITTEVILRGPDYVPVWISIGIGIKSGYAAAEVRAYHTSSGGSRIDGPGYGNYGQVLLEGVDAGDIIAMKLIDHTQGVDYWAFSQANELVAGQGVGHLWNYGLNIWGWEDGSGGGDKDYTDMVVGLDFTSTAGNGYLVNS